ncbi:MAG: tetratricopeptide (TPR) repeat protein [Gammaproteobacteria bacterium]|jgi:tetratricopeptide (TPR) repeat protein
MSLLMDALKKAEQDKKDAAKRLKDASADDQPLDDITQELKLEGDLVQQTGEAVRSEEIQDYLDVYANAKMEGLSLSPLGDEESVLEGDSSSSVDSPVVEESSLLDLSELDPISSTSVLSIAEDDDFVTDDVEFRIKEETISGITPDLDQTLVPELAPTDFQIDEAPNVPSDDTVQTVQMHVSETFDATSSDYEYFSATVSAAQLAKDIGANSPTPVAAQTVFTAISTNQGNQLLQWSAFLVLCLVIAVSLSLFIFNYTVPIQRSIKSPLVAKDIETQSQPVPVIEIPALASSTEIDSSLFTGEITDVIKKENEAVVEEGQIESGDEIANENSVDTLALTQEKIWYPEEDNIQEEKVSVAEIVEEATLTLPDRIDLEPKLIKISRSTSTDKSSELINKAYQEYLAGNYDAAEKNYRIVLNNLLGNRDALLGLAAIAIRKGQVRQAYANYLEVLRLYPGDSVAEAALINFKGNGDVAKNESILKTFIQREPENSFLYYSLGQLHSEQKRWPEAQQSFFNAYRIAPSNPDYAFNLAVSLDHIGQQKSAIDYYNIALELADNSSVSFATYSFDRAVVISRIKELSRALSSLVELQ